MLRHVVMFSWAESVDDAHISATSAALDALPGKIDAIKSYQHGRDLKLSDTTADYVVVADFDDVDGYVTYRDHPDHRAFVESYVAGRAGQRLAVQYEIS